MIVIRTDANKNIATGHLMRCLAIANECHNLGTPVCFVFADNESKDLLKKLSPHHENYEVKVLDTRYDDMEAELDIITKFLSGKKTKTLLFDSYYVTPKYLSELKKYCNTSYCKTYYLDDLKAFEYPVDVVINYTDTPSYTPLREQFRDVDYTVRENVSDILVTTGGTDDGNITGKVIEVIQSTLTGSVNIHAVIGVLNSFRDKLRILANENPNIKLYENHPEMAELMKKCDVAISTAGTTLFELCAVGIPTICFPIADNQIPGAKKLAGNEAVILMPEFDGQELADYLKELTSDYNKRKSLSKTMRDLIDGYGAKRIASLLCS